MTPVFVITVSDAIGIAFAALIFFLFLGFYLMTAWKQWRCKHDGGIGETQACEAICHKCGKNLGFIDNWRNRK